MNMYQVHLLPRNPRCYSEARERVQKQFNIRPGFLLRDVPGVAGREANFQAVGDTGEFYQDSCQPELNTALLYLIFSAVKSCGLMKRLVKIFYLFSSFRYLRKIQPRNQLTRVNNDWSLFEVIWCRINVKNRFSVLHMRHCNWYSDLWGILLKLVGYTTKTSRWHQIA